MGHDPHGSQASGEQLHLSSHVRHLQEVFGTDMSLREFSLDYKVRGYPRNQHAWSGKVVLTDVSSSSLVYVENLFTVEEYFLFPNSTVPLHSHPCDTVTIFLGGSFFGFSIGGSSTGSRKYTNADWGEVGHVLRAGDQHSALIGNNGAVSLVVTMWPDKVALNSAAIAWYGEPSGPMHKKLLDSSGLQKLKQSA